MIEDRERGPQTARFGRGGPDRQIAIRALHKDPIGCSDTPRRRILLLHPPVVEDPGLCPRHHPVDFPARQTPPVPVFWRCRV